MLTGSHGKHQILILSPEMAINNDNVRQCIQKLTKRIVCVVIDEAHCIASCGEGFRPAYSRIGEILSLVSPSVNFLAMTATAEERTRETILLTLNMQRPVVIKRSADRANIFYGIGKATSLKKLSGILVAGLKRYRNSYPKTIVFCRTW